MTPLTILLVLSACTSDDSSTQDSSGATAATTSAPTTDTSEPCPVPVAVCACTATVDLSAVLAELVDGARVGTVTAGRIDLSGGGWEPVVCDGLQQAELLDYEETTPPVDGAPYTLDLSGADGQGLLVFASDADGLILGSAWAEVQATSPATTLTLVEE